MKNLIISSIVVLFSFVSIHHVFAQTQTQTGNQLIPCGVERWPEGTPKVNGVDVSGTVKDYCDFKDFMTLINTVINFILFKLAIPIAAIMFCYAGFLMITAGDESAGAKTKAKNILWGVIKGLVFAAASYLIIKIILVTLGFDGSWIGF